MLLDKIEEPDARRWYVRATADGGWSRNVLLNQIKARAHARAGAAPSNFELTVPGEDSELAGQIAKDPYVFDFLRFSWRVAERDLETALVGRLPDTLLELDTGFAVRRAPGSPHISADQGTRHRRKCAIIERDWDEVAAAVGLSRAESDLMRLGPGAQILNRANTARRDNFAT